MPPPGTHSSTFFPAPLDGSLTFPQLLDRQLAQSPDHPVFIYNNLEGIIVSITFSQYIQTVHAASRLILREGIPHSPDGQVTVIGIFANADTISYCMMVTAIMRAGLIPFCISPRNAATGLANLLDKAGPTAVYVTPDLRSILGEALTIYGKALAVFDVLTFDRVHDRSKENTFKLLPPLPTAAMDSTGIILHSSGSTSTFTKPVYLSHQMVLQYASVACSSAEDHCGQIMGAQTLPNFHGIGIFISTWPFSAGITMAVLRPTNPPTLSNAENSLDGILATNPDFVMSTPANIESWSENPVGLKMMQNLKGLLYIGAQLNKRVGDTLVANRVVICSTYGSMETGVVTPFFTSYGQDWDYISVREEFNPVRVPEEDGSHFYTHTYLVSPSYMTAYTNTEIDGRPGCVVSDLLEQHPTNPNLHRVYGRKDDLISFSTAAKMNPVPIEAQIDRNPLVDGAVVFGHGHPYPGVLIQLKPQSHPDLADDEKRTRILDALWDSVNAANKTSPTHFQIPRKMVLLANPGRPFAVTSKLQPRRKVILESYDEEIRAAYVDF
ncbi:hypothetical protein C8F04DRAFT_1077661 [Mycena alexandri]|uniref:AMP-dependent synthetase/ligase domain-containing protein n=1 Tax=Mycena alexandri TaxID=1745969 RepID=A0AAD6T9B3_9AGAR|nr:hypothetical protein C8F04DRAFT_1077661 [Mycena alexandri]